MLSLSVTSTLNQPTKPTWTSHRTRPTITTLSVTLALNQATQPTQTSHHKISPTTTMLIKMGNTIDGGGPQLTRGAPVEMAGLEMDTVQTILVAPR